MAASNKGDVIHARLLCLGPTPEEVAAELERTGFLGVMGSDTENPIARFVRSRHTRADQYLIVVRAVADYEGGEYSIAGRFSRALPVPVAEFLVMFHNGQFPAVIDPFGDFASE